MNRRSFIASSGILPLAFTDSNPNQNLFSTEINSSRIKLSVSSYSYWHFKGEKYPITKVIDHAAALGLDGVDILHRQMESEDKSYINQIKRHAFEKGIALTCLSIHQGFVHPEKAELKKHIDHTNHCIQLAAEMGIPSMRLNTGRWGTIKSFDDFMAKRGQEPAIEGYTEDDAFKWCIDSIQECIPVAEKYGVLLALENHWGLGSTPEGMLRIMKAVNSPWLKLLMDTGNFLENPYSKLSMIAPYTSFVQAKTYYGGGVWYSLDLDYKRIIQILQKVSFQGYISIEFEGKDPGEQGVSNSVAMLRKAMK